MDMPYKRIRAAFLSVLCLAFLMFPARMTEGVAYAAEETVAADAESPTDNDALFYGYLLQRAGVSNRVSLLADARSKLDETDRKLYDQLKVMISEVAAGTRTSSVFELTYENFKTTWTAEELGVSRIVTAGNQISDEAASALFQKMRECFTTSPAMVVDALLADFPYELYWFDKSEGWSSGLENSVGAKGNSSGWIMTADSTLTYHFTFSVSRDYGSGTTVNRTLHKGIEKVVSNATAIVNAYRTRSDYEKLLGYSTEICERVEYDTAAAQNDDTPYGDPWQLISVFDDDDSTNVVCEGYSKAFKYLCDLSAFRSPKVECYLVTGLLGGGTGAGAHMWNLVTMENGKTYLVDVTNSDSNGGPDLLLLKGGSPHSQNPSQYTFYDEFAFVYDGETIDLWGSELLTLDTADYQPSPASEDEYEYELRNVTPSGAGVTVEIANRSGDGATLIVALYKENGQFLRAATESAKTADISKGTSDSVTLQLDTAGAKTVKAFLLDDTQKPLCPAFPYPIA